jgi:tetratricopeptide (TPR) repeat protein
MAQMESNFDWIEAYLADELSAEERSAFEIRLREDAGFADEVSLQRDTHRLVQVGANLNYKEELRRIDAEMERMRQQPFFKYLSFRVAAMFLLLLACGYAFVFFQYNNHRLFRQEFAPYPDKMIYRGTTTDANALIEAGMEAYARQDYPTAIVRLEQVVEADPDPGGAWLYLGISKLASGHPAEAIKALERAATFPLWIETARWYRVLALLETGENHAAKTALQAIEAEPTNAYREQAGRLMRKMEVFWRALPGL